MQEKKRKKRADARPFLGVESVHRMHRLLQVSALGVQRVPLVPGLPFCEDTPD